MVQTERSITFAHSMTGHVWRAEHTWQMSNANPMYFGFVIPEVEMVALGRDYSSSGTSLVVDLYEATFTGGTPVETLNRRLKNRNDTTPVQFLHTVTPGALTDRITGFAASSAGPFRVGRQGEVQPFLHDALVSYVLRISNATANNDTYEFAVDFRLLQPGEDK